MAFINKAQASIEVMISILIVLFLFTIVFLVSIMKGGDITEAGNFIRHREGCIKLSSVLFMSSVFGYSDDFSSKYEFEISRDKNILSIYKSFCYGYTKKISNILYKGEPGKFKISNIGGQVKIDKL